MPHPSVGLDAIIEHAAQQLVARTVEFSIGSLFGTAVQLAEVERGITAPITEARRRVEDVPPAFQEAGEDVVKAVERLIRRLFG